jgi:uncharacterized repeat protein (TIGR01451 family)
LIADALLAVACSDSAPTATSTMAAKAPRLYGGGGGLTGAIYTTDQTTAGGQCLFVNKNIYAQKQDVYLYGGPDQPTLAVGDYYVKITSPSDDLLGTSVITDGGNVTGGQVFHVSTDGTVKSANCVRLYDVLKRASDGSPGYDDTPNNGGEYKVWVSTDPTFANNALVKTDNFKVRRNEDGCTDTDCLNEVPDVMVTKTPGSQTVSIGSPISFTITATSIGTVAVDNVSISDQLAAIPGMTWSVTTQPSGTPCVIASNLLTCAGRSLAKAGGAGDSYSVTVTAAPNTVAPLPSSATCGTITNTATATFDVPVVGGTVPQSSPSQQVSATIQCPSVTLSKAATSATVTYGAASSTVGFDVTVTNAGPVAATNVVVTDALPALSGGLAWVTATPGCTVTSNTLTCTVASLGIASVSFHVETSANINYCGTITNPGASATADYVTIAPATGRSVVVSGCPTITVKKFYDANGNGKYDGLDVWLSGSNGWKASVLGPSYSFTGTTQFTLNPTPALPLGAYTVTEAASLIGAWTQSAAYWYAAATPGSTTAGAAFTLAAGDDKTVVFGNYCTQAAAGWTIGFWSNNNGQARLATVSGWQSLVGYGSTMPSAAVGGQTLNYKLWQAKAAKNGTLAVSQFLLSNTSGTPSTSKSTATGSYLELQNWLLGAQASNNGSALYMLSAQFAAAVFNAKIGGTSDKLDVTATLPGTSKTILQIMQEVASLLNSASPTVDNKVEYTTYIGYLNQINNKGSVIPAAPCTTQF